MIKGLLVMGSDDFFLVFVFDELTRIVVLYVVRCVLLEEAVSIALPRTAFRFFIYIRTDS